MSSTILRRDALRKPEGGSTRTIRVLSSFSPANTRRGTITNDLTIRQTLRAALRTKFRASADVLVIDEFGVSNGDGRIDLAVVNSCLHGYEIKSDRDSLDRLPNQIRLFSDALDAVTLVVGWRHIVRAMRMVPRWWGVQLAELRDDGGIDLIELREPLPNPRPDPHAVASLLWRDEALAVLETYGADAGVRSKRRAAIYHRLAEAVPLPRLRRAVTERIKARGDWRFGARSA